MKVSSTFSKVVGVRGQSPCGLFSVSKRRKGSKNNPVDCFCWEVSAAASVSAERCPLGTRAPRRAVLPSESPIRRGFPQASLKPAPSARCPLAEATAVFQPQGWAVFQSAVPPLPLPGLSASQPMRSKLLTQFTVRCTFPPAAPGKVKVVERCSTPRKLLKKFDQNFYAASRFGSAFILPADCAGPAPAWPCPGSAPGSWGTPGSPWSPAPARSSTGRESYAAGTAVLQNFPIGSRR